MFAAIQHFVPLLAQQDPPPEFFVILAVVVLVLFLVGLAIQCLILYLLYNAFNSCPPQFRLIEPWQVWLLLIPCFPIVWNFFVYQKIPESFRNYFNSIGRHEQGDCGQQLGLWYSILICCSLIPYIGALPGLASFVVLIIFLVKMYELKRIADQSGGFAGGGYQGVGSYTPGNPSNPYASLNQYGQFPQKPGNPPYNS